MIVCLVFFFKQKTAYEMRISDWSSDVCSSDLTRVSAGSPRCAAASSPSSIRVLRSVCPVRATPRAARSSRISTATLMRCSSKGRSEEHTSELQSLMRISYAVFCLKKKKTQQDTYSHTSPTNNHKHQ